MKEKDGKRKMQNVDFNSVEDFLVFLKKDELKMVELLRDTVFETLPGVKEKLSYNVPFYKLNSNICFIWPGSVTWGNVSQKCVRFGFTRGILLKDEINFLNLGSRKTVGYKDYRNIKEIDTKILMSFLIQAADIDEEIANLKKTSK